MDKSFYICDKTQDALELRQGSICKFKGVSGKRLRTYKKKLELEGLDEKEINEKVSTLKQMRFVILSQSCDIKNKKGFRGLESLYSLSLFDIKTECLPVVERMAEYIASQLGSFTKKITNPVTRKQIEQKIAEKKLQEALNLLQPVMKTSEVQKVQERIKHWKSEGDLFEDILKRGNNSNYEDCFFFPKEKTLGILGDSAVRFAYPFMLPRDDITVIGRMNHPYCEALAQRFGTYFFRVALP